MFHENVSCLSKSNFSLLTPNEKQRILKSEREKRRVARLIQVRQQSSEQAKKIREEVKSRKTQELQKVHSELKNQVRKNKTRAIQSLESELNQNLKQIGEAQRRARLEPNYELIKAARSKLDSAKAIQRHKSALKRLRDVKQEQEKEKKKILERKQRVYTEANQRARNLKGLEGTERLDAGPSWRVETHRKSAGRDTLSSSTERTGVQDNPEDNFDSPITRSGIKRQIRFAELES